MKSLTPVGFLWIFLLFPAAVQADSCRALDSDLKIKQFLRSTTGANPLLRNKVSTQLNITTCKGIACIQGDGKEKEGPGSVLHYLKMYQNLRVHYVNGPNQPNCLLNKGRQLYRCTSCSRRESKHCRRISDGSSGSMIGGTNFDFKDLQILTSQDYSLACKALPADPRHVKFLGTRKGAKGQYDQFALFHDVRRRVPVEFVYFSENVMRKTYYFSPEGYIHRAGEWVATSIRVRSVTGERARYSFETLIRVVRDREGEFALSFNPLTDHFLRGSKIAKLFSLQ